MAPKFSTGAHIVLLVLTNKLSMLKRPWRHMAIPMLLLALAWYVPVAAAQGTVTENVSGVDITVSFDKTRVMVGEPVTMTITLENRSPSPFLDFSTNFQLAEGNKLEVVVQPADDLAYRYTGAMPMGSYSDVPFKLVRGLPVAEDVMLLYDATQPQGYVFSEPGTYYIEGSFQFRVRNTPMTSSIEIPRTQINVAPATGAAAEVYELVNEPEIAKALHRGVATTDTLSQIQQAAERYPGTELGALAMRAAGRFYTQGAQPEDRARGAEMLSDYIARGVVPADGDSTIHHIATAWHLNQEYDVARQWIIYLVRNYPNSGHIREEDALVYYYFLQPAQFAAQVPWYLLKRPWIVPGAEPPTDLSPRKVE